MSEAALLAALWRCYVASGGDPDGNDRWHCSPEDAARAAIAAVEQLRRDYDNGVWRVGAHDEDEDDDA